MRGAMETFVLRPNSSLGQAQYLGVVALFGLLSAMVGGACIAFGAWPVAGFLALELALVTFALRRSMAAAQELEMIVIDADRLVWTSIRPTCATRRLEFARRFVRVSLNIDRQRDLVGALTLQSAGRSHEIGRFLGGEERRAFAAALRAALAR
jgi:uncharacterized membrane protein